jgi:hypothetical protein
VRRAEGPLRSDLRVGHRLAEIVREDAGEPHARRESDLAIDGLAGQDLDRHVRDRMPLGMDAEGVPTGGEPHDPEHAGLVGTDQVVDRLADQDRPGRLRRLAVRRQDPDHHVAGAPEAEVLEDHRTLDGRHDPRVVPGGREALPGGPEHVGAAEDQSRHLVRPVLPGGRLPRLPAASGAHDEPLRIVEEHVRSVAGNGVHPGSRDGLSVLVDDLAPHRPTRGQADLRLAGLLPGDELQGALIGGVPLGRDGHGQEPVSRRAVEAEGPVLARPDPSEVGLEGDLEPGARASPGQEKDVRPPDRTTVPRVDHATRDHQAGLEQELDRPPLPGNERDPPLVRAHEAARDDPDDRLSGVEVLDARRPALVGHGDPPGLADPHLGAGDRRTIGRCEDPREDDREGRAFRRLRVSARGAFGGSRAAVVGRGRLRRGRPIRAPEPDEKRHSHDEEQQADRDDPLEGSAHARLSRSASARAPWPSPGSPAPSRAPAPRRKAEKRRRFSRTDNVVEIVHCRTWSLTLPRSAGSLAIGQ